MSDPILDRDHLSDRLAQVAEAARQYLARVDHLPAGGTARRDEAADHFVGELPEDGPDGIPEGELDQLNRRLGQAIIADGTVYFGTRVYAGKVAFRPAIANWRTTERDVDIILGVVRGLAER